MGWDGSGNFNRTDGTRTGINVWAQADAAGVGIIAADADTHDQDIADGLENCLTKDNQVKPSANTDWNAKRITNLGAAAARTDAIRADEVQDSASVWGGTSAGTADAQTFTLTPTLDAYVTGQRFSFEAGAGLTNTGACTINIDSLGAKNVKLVDGTDPSAGTITAGEINEVLYDGTNMVLLSVPQLEAAYCSVSVAALSNSFQNEMDIFDEDNYSAFSKTEHVTAVGITYDQTDGTFNFGKTGIYQVTLDLATTCATANTSATIDFKVDTVSFYALVQRITAIGATGYNQLSMSFIKSFAAGEDLNVTANVDTAVDAFIAADGTTMTIHKIA